SRQDGARRHGSGDPGGARAGQTGGDAGRGAGHLGSQGAGLRAPLRSRLRDDHRLARLRVHEERKRWRGERDMTTQGTKESLGRDVDDVAIERFTAEYGRELPPIVIVIAAYN